MKRVVRRFGRFADACDHMEFCPAGYLSESMQRKWCADGCCVACGILFKEAHPKVVEKLADEWAFWGEYIEEEHP